MNEATWQRTTPSWTSSTTNLGRITTMANKQRPVKTRTLDRQLQRREANKQKQPHPISKFDKGLRLSDKGQYPKQ
jgi:hypothetical protein